MTPWVKRLLIANILVWVFIWPGLIAGLPAELVLSRLAFVPAYLPFQPWTAVTYMFLHAEHFFHILFNMLILFFFGPRLEAKLGGRRFILLYMISGIMGALISFLGALPALLGMDFAIVPPLGPIVGASGAVLGVLYGFARYWPREKIYIWAILPVESRWLVAFLVVFSLFAGFGGAQDGIAHFAHLGGLLGGFLFIRWHERNTGAARFKRQVEGPKVRLNTGRELERWRTVDRDDLHPLNRQEYDRLLEKADRHGVGSLTPMERGFLERFVRD